LLLGSCSSIRIVNFWSEKKPEIRIDQSISQDDYADHLANLKLPFIQNPQMKILKLSNDQVSYLNFLGDEIIKKNEIFFRSLKRLKINILNMNQPLHFSLPKGEVFMSTGLVTKYLKHESILVSILSYELIKSEKLLYPRQTLVPTGYVNLEKLIALNRLAIDENMEVHKWAYHITRRAGFDGEYYLYWLQTQNRNTADFIMQVGDINQMNREESLFKAFLIKDSIQVGYKVTSKNSSKKFYKFVNDIKGYEL